MLVFVVCWFFFFCWLVGWLLLFSVVQKAMGKKKCKKAMEEKNK